MRRGRDIGLDLSYVVSVDEYFLIRMRAMAGQIKRALVLRGF
jgi:hypothetical protein